MGPVSPLLRVLPVSCGYGEDPVQSSQVLILRIIAIVALACREFRLLELLENLLVHRHLILENGEDRVALEHTDNRAQVNLGNPLAVLQRQAYPLQLEEIDLRKSPV